MHKRNPSTRKPGFPLQKQKLRWQRGSFKASARRTASYLPSVGGVNTKTMTFGLESSNARSCSNEKSLHRKGQTSLPSLQPIRLTQENRSPNPHMYSNHRYLHVNQSAITCTQINPSANKINPSTSATYTGSLSQSAVVQQRKQKQPANQINPSTIAIFTAANQLSTTT